MAGRRIIYLLCLMGCGVFYYFYQKWFSWLALVGMAALPWLSLVLSLPAMLTTHIEARCGGTVCAGDTERLTLVGSCVLPMPTVRGKARACHSLTGQTYKIHAGGWLPTTCCGRLDIRVQKARVWDYLGLFQLPVLKRRGCVLLVRPIPRPMEAHPDLSRYFARAFRPKIGGGFGENHELRLYRPGDPLQQIHWKLSAKTGKLILREPMEPIRGLAVVTLTLSGTAEQIDWKLGRLLWLSGYLLEQQVPHQVRCRTGNGTQSCAVDTQEDIWNMLDGLLLADLAPEEAGPEVPERASRHYHIGGDRDEA